MASCNERETIDFSSKIRESSNKLDSLETQSKKTLSTYGLSYQCCVGAPKQPLSGYVHFLNFRRDSVRKEFPEMSFAEISKKLAQEWSQLDAEEKQTYVKKAEEDKERYNREFTEYQQTDAYKQFVTMQKEKEKMAKNQAESTPSGSGNAGSSSVGSKKKKGSSKDNKEKGTSSSMKMDEDTNPGSPSSGSFLDIPIFREDFLEHNKSREAELKQLRKQVKASMTSMALIT